MRIAGQTRASLTLTAVVSLRGSYPAFATLALAHLPLCLMAAVRRWLTAPTTRVCARPAPGLNAPPPAAGRSAG